MTKVPWPAPIEAAATGPRTGLEAKKRQAAYEVAVKDCLERAVLDRTVGPEHPDVAQRLHTLANHSTRVEKYDMAGRLYEQVIAIPEQSRRRRSVTTTSTWRRLSKIIRGCSNGCITARQSHGLSHSGGRFLDGRRAECLS